MLRRAKGLRAFWRLVCGVGTNAAAPEAEAGESLLLHRHLSTQLYMVKGSTLGNLQTPWCGKNIEGYSKSGDKIERVRNQLHEVQGMPLNC